MARIVPEGIVGLNAAKSLWTAMLAKLSSLIPTPTAADNGKFLRVVNGIAVWEEIPEYMGGEY